MTDSIKIKAMIARTPYSGRPIFVVIDIALLEMAEEVAALDAALDTALDTALDAALVVTAALVVVLAATVVVTADDSTVLVVTVDTVVVVDITLVSIYYSGMFFKYQCNIRSKTT